MQDCSAELVELAPCLSYVFNQSPNPSATCCDALETVVMKTPICICELVSGGKNGTANTGLPPVNLTLVRQLPSDCGVQSEVHKDEAICRVHGAPAPAPYPYDTAGATGSPSLVAPVLVPLVWAVISICVPVFICQLCSLPSFILKA
ncbi:unnamed protein product [Calypogeia fissa]